MEKNIHGGLTSIEERFFQDNADSTRDDYLRQLQEIESQLLVIFDQKLTLSEREHTQALLEAVEAGMQIVQVMSQRSEKLKRMRGRV
jgi:phosphosulfolactate synthase (CoM biosynthesis protein A)